VSDELERRLRESLRAYADLVDTPDDDSLPLRLETARPVLRRWRGAVLAAAAAAVVVTGSVWIVSDRDDGSSSAAGSAASALSAEEDMRAEAPTSDSGATATAESGGLADAAVPAEGFLPSLPEPGVAYPVDLSTHCGVRGIDIGGVWFAADPPLVEAGGHPPAGWGNPDQRGTITRLSETEAVFRDDAGHEVRLRADESARPPLCE
jgi:hypothetical protein